MKNHSSKRIYEELPEDTDFDALDWLTLSREHGLPEWMAGTLEEADRVEREFGTRYVRVPKEESHGAYQDMEEFIETVRSARLRERLEQAIGGRGSFRRFKDVLEYHERERERWFAFKAERLREHVLAWLADEGIEATPRQ